VIINDGSTDGSAYIYRHYFQFYNIHPRHYLYIENPRRTYALANYYQAVHRHCHRDSIVITLDGDDELVGRNVFKLFNWAYQTKRAGVVYSNFYWYDQGRSVREGFTEDYTPQEKARSAFRQVPMKFSQLRSFLAELFLLIDPKDFQDEKGEFFSISSDVAMFVPLMELACGRVAKIEGEYNYLYNFNTGLNDVKERKRQTEVEASIRSMKAYECYEPFNYRMQRAD
jgi:glycosyltransferase involved in cell wall biosynthesis